MLCNYLKKGSEHDLEWLLDSLYAIEGKVSLYIDLLCSVAAPISQISYIIALINYQLAW